ncbi:MULTISPECIES: hypothetical protein [unclassified Streptomyces]
MHERAGGPADREALAGQPDNLPSPAGTAVNDTAQVPATSTVGGPE